MSIENSNKVKKRGDESAGIKENKAESTKIDVERSTKVNTKKRILEIALDLFAKKGYHNVSIRDICGEVGIKESSIYYHFTNKQAIMDSLIEQVNEFIKEKQEIFDKTFSGVNSVPIEAMCAVAVGLLKLYLLDPLVFRVISVLTIERLADERAAEEYNRIVFELPLKQQERVFKEMIERGYIKENSPEVLAREYYSIIFFSFQKNCLGGNLSQERNQTAYHEIIDGIRDIYKKMII